MVIFELLYFETHSNLVQTFEWMVFMRWTDFDRKFRQKAALSTSYYIHTPHLASQVYLLANVNRSLRVKDGCECWGVVYSIMRLRTPSNVFLWSSSLLFVHNIQLS
jgi:hypothetical protein